jgi:type II secretory pathway pseudopilin PulG
MKLTLKNLKSPRAFSLVELLVYLTLIAVVSNIFFVFSVDVIRSMIRITNTKEVHQNTRFLLATIGQDIKTARQIISVEPQRLTLINHQAETVEYIYKPAYQKVIYSDGSTETDLSSPSVQISQLVFEAIGRGVKITLSVQKDSPAHISANPYQLSLSSLIVPRPQLY